MKHVRAGAGDFRGYHLIRNVEYFGVPPRLAVILALSIDGDDDRTRFLEWIRFIQTGAMQIPDVTAYRFLQQEAAPDDYLVFLTYVNDRARDGVQALLGSTPSPVPLRRKRLFVARLDYGWDYLETPQDPPSGEDKP